METRSNYVMVGAVTVALLAGVLLFIVWLAGLSNKATKCYDIYFAQGVGGLNKGSNVSFSGVPVGQVSKISLLPNRPEFVWVRIEVDEQTPVLQGTTRADPRRRLHRRQRNPADGAVRGSRPISRSGRRAARWCRRATGGLGALLNSAPELIDRIQRLTERLTELLSDKNQNSIADILENIDATTAGASRERAPEMGRGDRATCGSRARNAGVAAQQHCGALRQHQPAGDEAGPPGRAGSAQGDRLGPAGGRQSQRDDHRRPARRSEFQQVDACPKPTGWSTNCASCRSRSSR